MDSSLVSSRVCQSCGRKIFDAAELFHFICSGIERNVEVPFSSTPHKKKDSQARIKRLLPSSVSSPDRSPQPRKGIFRNSLPSAPLGNMRKIMRRIIYYDWHMYSPRPIRFSSHWCASYSKYRGFLAGGISNASSPRPFLDRGSAAKTLIAQYRQLRRLSVRRSTTTALNVNTNVKLWCSFAGFRNKQCKILFFKSYV